MLYHIVLIKLKPSTTSDQLEAFRAAGKKMVGPILGLKSFNSGSGIVSTSHRAQGYQYGLLAVLENPESLSAYAAHPAHQETNRIRELIAEQTLAFDFED